MSKLKIIYKIHKFSGGAPRSLLAFAKVMKSLGHEVIAIGEPGPIQDSWEEAGIRVFESKMVERRKPFYSWLETQKLKEVISDFAPDVIQTATIDEGFFLRLLVPNIPILQTIAGGKGPTNRSLIWRDLPVVGFSSECLETLRSQIPDYRGNVWLRKERLDVKYFIEKAKEKPTQTLPPKPIILHVSRLEGDKIEGVKQIIEAYCELFRRNVSASLVIVGGGKEEHFVREFANKKRYGLSDASIMFTGTMKNPYPYYRYADIITGVGRSVLEGMVFAKPAIVVGELGSAGIVNETTAQTIVDYNFSGRNLKKKATINNLINDLLTLLKNKEYYKKCAAFSKEFVLREYDVWSHAKDIEEMYRQCASSIDCLPSHGLIFFEGMKLFVSAALKKAKRKLFNELYFTL
ncbi:glycosyltransferase family 4 protein [Acetomicrobium sp.]|uniref:glycosyltransferase family 4 protein n=1 Tax=Acetomicrobium sp. TaxID=1872099 RepID=UPI002B25CCC5|nr:glycosyltransferase family 4 protein [Acetomicrobium sp.]